MTVTFVLWLRRVEAVLQSIERSRELPYQESCPQRAASWTAFPVVCAPCLLWSTLLRLLSCEPGGNGCTRTTDACVREYVEAVEARDMVPVPEQQPYNLAVRDAYELAELARIVSRLLASPAFGSDEMRVYVSVPLLQSLTPTAPLSDPTGALRLLLADIQRHHGATMRAPGMHSAART